MEKKRISNDISVSEYCLGTMYFGTKVAEKQSFRLMDIYAESGGNFLDSANKYASWIPGFSGGESELVVGKWLKEQRREDFVLTTKVGFPYGDIPKSLSPDVIVSECEKSLKRLGTDYIDIYFAHTQDDGIPLEDTMGAFDSLIKSGKVRCIGASNHGIVRFVDSNNVSKEYGYSPYMVLQQRYSLLQPYQGADFGTQMVMTPEQIEYCHAKGISLMAYSPLLGGIFEKSDSALPIQYDSLHNRKIINLLKQYADAYGYTPSRFVLAVLSECQNIIPIVAASSDRHLSENLDIPDSAIVRKLWTEISETDVFTTKY